MPAGGKAKKIRFASFVETFFHWIKISGCCHVLGMQKKKKKMGETGKKNDKSRGREEIVGGTVKISGENSWRGAMLRRRNFCKRFPTTMQPRSFYFR